MASHAPHADGKTGRVDLTLPVEAKAKLQRYAKANKLSLSYAASLMLQLGLQSWASQPATERRLLDTMRQRRSTST